MKIRLMTVADVPLGMRLKEQNGWNQLAMDWHRLLSFEPEGCFVGEWNRVPVATACTCVFDEVAWIAMVLVDSGHRGQGIGSTLVSHAVDYLDGRGVRSIRLDATPVGRPIYERLGFAAEYDLARHEGILPATAAGPMDGVERIDFDPVEQREQLIHWDRIATGTNRNKLLVRLCAELPEAMRVVQRDGHIEGYLTFRPGSQALQIGPCIATADAGRLLFADVAQRCAGHHVFIDIPIANTIARTTAETMGLSVQRHLLRMGRGKPVQEMVDTLWASSGPEKG